MSDLKKYIDKRKEEDKKFTKGYDEGYANFKRDIKTTHRIRIKSKKHLVQIIQGLYFE